MTPGFFGAEIWAGDLVGPLADFPLDELVRRLGDNEIYVNMQTSAFPLGELRGQMMRTL